MRPMTIVVVREEPAGGSEAGTGGFASDAVAGFSGAADAVVAGAAADAAAPGAAVAGAAAEVAAAGAAGLAVDWARRAGAARTSRARATGSAMRRFMAGKTIDRGQARQAPARRA